VNIAYALVQVMHNFGAVAVVGGPAAAWLRSSDNRSVPAAFAWLTIVGWAMQVTSGVGFGITTYFSRGELPEIAGVALLALYVKVGCALGGLLLAAYFLKASAEGREHAHQWIWPSLFFAGAVALSGAAFLRWFS